MAKPILIPAKGTVELSEKSALPHLGRSGLEKMMVPWFGVVVNKDAGLAVQGRPQPSTQDRMQY
jgi:hypothetical protein